MSKVISEERMSAITRDLPDYDKTELGIALLQVCGSHEELRRRLARKTYDWMANYGSKAEAWDEADQMRRSLRNVMMLSHRIRKRDPENADHLLRFCRDAGVVPSILRDDGTAPGAASGGADE